MTIYIDIIMEIFGWDASYDPNSGEIKVLDEEWRDLTPDEVSQIEAARPAFELKLAKERKRQEMMSRFDAAMSEITSKYPEAEMLSWDKQESESRAYLNDPNTTTPLLDAICTIRGVDKDYMANRIIQKAQEYAQAVGLAIGRRQKLDDDIDNAAFMEDLKKITWEPAQ